MNGYTLSQFGDFQKNWRFVTVRYRKDTSELRFTYANESAWETLRAGKTKYAKGAVFAKVAYATRPDPAFHSSATPSGVRRYQLMVRDETKHKDTGGWGYALFDADFKTLPEDHKVQSAACAACHNMVPQRGFVFSQPIHLEQTSLVNNASDLKFQRVLRSSLPDRVKPLVPSTFKEVDLVTGPLTENLFQGTLDEIKPTLLEKAFATNSPAFLISRDGRRYSAVVPAPGEKDCSASGESGSPFRSIHNFLDQRPPFNEVVCYRTY